MTVQHQFGGGEAGRLELGEPVRVLGATFVVQNYGTVLDNIGKQLVKVW